MTSLLALQPTPSIDFHLAPLLDWTTAPARYLCRLLSPSLILYTEMVASGTILHSPLSHTHESGLSAPWRSWSKFTAEELPNLVFQIGGSNPEELYHAARQVKDQGFLNINLNAGCPSQKVTTGAFGAFLYTQPQLLEECLDALLSVYGANNTSLKTRIGVDDIESYDYAYTLVDKLQKAGLQHIIFHARKAILNGPSPKYNRNVPPLNYPFVRQLKSDFPHLHFTLNGGVNAQSLSAHLQHNQEAPHPFEGFMIGRWIMNDTLRALITVNHLHTHPSTPETIHRALRCYQTFIHQALLEGCSKSALLKPLHNLFPGLPGCRRWRQQLTFIQQESHLTTLLVRLDHLFQEIPDFSLEELLRTPPQPRL